MNILFSTVSYKDTDDWVNKLLTQIKFNECAVIFYDKAIAANSEISGYATECFFFDKMVYADYSDFPEYMLNAPPVDEHLLNLMAPYQSQIMWMMERCVGREYNHRWNDYCKHIRFWNYVLDKLKIDLFVSQVIPHEVFDYIIYVLCKIKGIKYLGMYQMSYYGMAYFCNDIYDHMPYLKKEFEEAKLYFKGRTESDIVLPPLIEEIYNFYTCGDDRTPYYMKDSDTQLDSFLVAITKRISCLGSLKLVAQNMKRRLRLIATCLLYCGSFSNVKCFNISEMFYNSDAFRESNMIFQLYQDNISQVDYSLPYIYFPLQVQPELSTSPAGGVYVDQLLVLKMLSFYLPKNWVIYVKEHPKQAEMTAAYHLDSYRSYRFFDEMLRVPNVKLVSLDEDTYNLINNAKAVVTMTGTAGLEAITSGVPCLMFGYSFLQYAPNVYHIRDNEDCEKAIKSIQFMEKTPEYRKDLKIYFKCLGKYLIDAQPELGLYTSLKEIEAAKDKLIQAYYKQIMEQA